MDEIPKHDLDRVLEAWSEAKERGEGTTIESFCSGDSELEHAARSRIQRLSAIEGALGLNADGSEGEPAFGVGSRVGRYELERYIGEGGFGVVFEASRTDGLLGRFAVKLLSRSMYSRDARARFENECRALTIARHDYIASVIDAGVTDQGVPYLVMTYIEGETLTEHCVSEKLEVRSRLRLFLQVCSAVEHAHAKGVIHRDLKPGNMLIESSDAGVSLRVIDFGIARVIDDVDQSRERFTQAGDLVGTAAYMSPEQLGVLDSEPDTRSDIYSMGVVLYELVCGWLPFQRSINENLTVYELQRRLRETSPTSVSGRRRTAENAQTDNKGEAVLVMPGTAELSLRELNCVVMKCLALEPEHRYATCRELAEEIRRLLDGRPVAAGPQSKGYLLRKYIQRHRVGVVSAAILLIVVIAAASFTSYGLFTAAREGRRAVLAEEVTKKVAEFQAERLSLIDSTAMGDSIRSQILEIVRDASKASGLSGEEIEAANQRTEDALAQVTFADVATRVLQDNIFAPSVEAAGAQFADQPEILGRLLHSIGVAQTMIGMFDDGLHTHEAASRVLRDHFGIANQETLASLTEYANTLRGLGRQNEARIVLHEAMEAQRELTGDESVQLFTMRNDYAMTLFGLGQVEEAESYLSEVVAGVERDLGESHHLTATVRGNFGDLLDSLGRSDEAEPYHRASLRGNEREFGPRHQATIISRNNLAKCLVLQGKYEVALPELENTVRLSREELGRKHQTTMLALSNLAITLQRTGHLERAILINSELLEARLEMLGVSNLNTMISMNVQAGLLLKTGDAKGALAQSERVVEAAEKTLGQDRYETAIFHTTLAQALAATGQYESAGALFERVHSVFAETIGTENMYAQNNVKAALEMYTSLNVDNDGAAYDEQIIIWRSRLVTQSP